VAVAAGAIAPWVKVTSGYKGKKPAQEPAMDCNVTKKIKGVKKGKV
jgi:hypothetical protein